MADATASREPLDKKKSWIRRHWTKVVPVALALSAVLGWYDAVRNNGRLFICDVAGIVGQQDALSICQDKVAPLNDSEQLALLVYLREREEDLNSDQRRQLRELEAYFIDRAFAVLTAAAGIGEVSTEAQA